MGLVQIGGEIRAKPLNDNFAYLDGKLLFGPESNRPNPGTANRLYVTIDTGIVYADTGTEWIQVGGISQIDWANIAGKPSTFPPSPHANQHRSGGSDPLTPADIGAASQVDFDAHLAESAKKHIHESGRNANGEYIRFDDGTQICWREADIDFNVGAYQRFDYPASMIAERPIYQAKPLLISYNGSSALSAAVLDRANRIQLEGEAHVRWRLSVRDTDNATGKVLLFAIGRWK